MFKRFKHDATTSHHSWIIQPQLPWYKKPSIVLSLTVISSCMISSYYYLNYSLYNTKRNLVEVNTKYNNLKAEHTALKIIKVKLQRELEISKQSHITIKEDLLQIHQDTQVLTEQLDLYKRIMSANRSSESILIENLQLRKIAQGSDYYLSWVLLQASNKRRLMQGKLDIKITGKLGDIAKNFNYSQIAINKKPGLTYKFRDFQQFNQKIKLPEDFVVENVTIDVIDDKTKLTKSKVFDWDNLGRPVHVAQAQDEKSRLQSNA